MASWWVTTSDDEFMRRQRIAAARMATEKLHPTVQNAVDDAFERFAFWTSLTRRRSGVPKRLRSGHG